MQSDRSAVCRGVWAIGIAKTKADAIELARKAREHGAVRQIAEPHLYSVSTGVPRVLVYLVDEAIKRDCDRWQLVDVADIVELDVLDRTFPGRRPLPPEFEPDNQVTKPKLSPWCWKR